MDTGWTERSAKPGVTRRSLLRGATAAAAVGLGGAALAACGEPGKAAKGTAANYKIVITFQPNGTIPFNQTTQELYQAALAPYYKSHPGVGVKVVPSQWGANAQAILGGSSADVISDNYPPNYMSPSGNLLLKLDDLIRKDNVDRTQWSSAQITSYVQAAPDHGLYMLPGYYSPLIYVVRLSDFDTAGYSRPDPNWDYNEFVQVCQKMTKQLSNGQKRYGAVIQWESNGLSDSTYMFYAWWSGGMINSQGYDNLEAPANIQAGKWLYEQLFWPGYASTRDQLGPWYGTNEVISDQVVIQLCWDGLVLDNAQRYTGFQWDYYLPPRFPQGPTCMGTDDFYAISAITKYPEQSWDLLKFLSYDATATGWQRQMMKIGLLQPCLNSLWDEWIATLRAVAPPLQDKNLEAFKTMAINGRGFPEEYFPYADSQVHTMAGPVMSSLWNQTTTVEAAFPEIDHQVNAFLQTVIQNAKVEEKVAAAIAAVTPGPTTNYPAPSAAGIGQPATDASSYVQSSNGTWTLLGDGADLSVQEDDAIYACQAAAASEGSWTCRVTGISNVSEESAGQPQLSNWIKVGILARSDLSDNAAEVGLVVTGAYGLQFFARATAAATSLLDYHFLWPKDAQGAVEQFSSPPTTPVPNFITKPIWLRLTRKGTAWTAFASLDGSNFQQVAQSIQVRGLGGAWMGLVCCAHNSDFSNVGYIRATFDDLTGFTPDHEVQLGVTGIPPSAGTVPANWATANASAASSSSSSSSSSSK